jgi:hypothetical protein
MASFDGRHHWRTRRSHVKEYTRPLIRSPVGRGECCHQPSILQRKYYDKYESAARRRRCHRGQARIVSPSSSLEQTPSPRHTHESHKRHWCVQPQLQSQTGPERGRVRGTFNSNPRLRSSSNNNSSGNSNNSQKQQQRAVAPRGATKSMLRCWSEWYWRVSSTGKLTRSLRAND